MTGEQKSPRRSYNDIVAMMQAEHDRVNELAAQGDEGIQQLRGERVRSYTAAYFPDSSPAEQESLVSFLMPLADEADTVIDGRPNSLLMQEVSERLEGRVRSTFVTMLRAGWDFRIDWYPLHFVYIYHLMHATKLISPAAVVDYQALARNPDVTRGIIQGRESSSLPSSAPGYPRGEADRPEDSGEPPRGWLPFGRETPDTSMDDDILNLPSPARRKKRKGS